MFVNAGWSIGACLRRRFRSLIVPMATWNLASLIAIASAGRLDGQEPGLPSDLLAALSNVVRDLPGMTAAAPAQAGRSVAPD